MIMLARFSLSRLMFLFIVSFKKIEFALGRANVKQTCSQLVESWEEIFEKQVSRRKKFDILVDNCHLTLSYDDQIKQL